MKIDIAHATGACSTLIIYDFGTDSKDLMKETIKDWFLGSNIKELQHNIWDEYEDDWSYGDSYKVTRFSFVMASTIEYQVWADTVLKELGFKPTPFVHNSKNDTSPRLWFISVPELIAALKELP